MHHKVLIARPRLDCSFKKGDVPRKLGPPRNEALRFFGLGIDGLEKWHKDRGDEVETELRPLWQFELSELQESSHRYDTIYFPHRRRQEFPIGSNAIYYKNAPFPEWLTLDPDGWGASMSWIPLAVSEPPPIAWTVFRNLRQRVTENISLFTQPELGRAMPMTSYLLFICQVPHDETIRFHSNVTVDQALAAVLGYAAQSGHHVVVKGHPANPGSMRKLRAMSEASKIATWVEDISIHTCLASAERVFLVNSGVGFEAMLHDKPIVRFGHAEYASVTYRAECNIKSIQATEGWRHSLNGYVDFLYSYLSRCIRYDQYESYARVLEPLMAQISRRRVPLAVTPPMRWLF